MLYTPYGLYLTKNLNGIENYPDAGEIFLENVILKVSQTHFSKDFYQKGGGGHTFFKGGGAMPPPRGAVKYPGLTKPQLRFV